MTREQKARYFRDYYLLWTVIFVLAAAAVIYVVWSFVRPKEEEVFNAAIFDATLTDDELDPLRTSLMSDFGADGKNKTVVLDSNFDMQAEGSTRLVIYIQAKQVDVVIAGKEDFQKLAASGFFADASAVLDADDLTKFQSDFVEAPGFNQTDSEDMDYIGTGQGEVLPYGIDISGSSVWKETGSSLSDPVLAFVQNSQNRENAVHFLEKLSV